MDYFEVQVHAGDALSKAVPVPSQRLAYARMEERRNTPSSGASSASSPRPHDNNGPGYFFILYLINKFQMRYSIARLSSNYLTL